MKKAKNLALKRAKRSGIEEGKLSIIRNLLNSGMKLDEISNVTGLSKEEIEELLNKTSLKKI